MVDESMRWAAVVCIVLGLGAGAVCQNVEQNPPPVTPEKIISLFNGKDLSNFYSYLRENKYSDPRQVFKVEGGLIRISGQEWGGLTTRRAFRNYHLAVDWKWGKLAFGTRIGHTRDSGILVHGVGPDGVASGAWLESIECQVIEGGCGDLILVAGAGRPSLTAETRTGPDGQLYWHKGGEAVTRSTGRFNWFGRDPEWKDVFGFRGRNDVEKPAGEWNRSEVICDGDAITNLVNGVVVNHGTQASPSQGKIQIQSEGAEIFIRRIELRPLR